MKPAIGLVELNSIAQGISAGDAMVKRAEVELLEARTICPGKYMVLIGGDTGPVGESMESGIEVGADTVVDRPFLPNAHPSLFPAIAGAVQVEEVEALGIIETISVASTIIAADAAAKEANVILVDIRLANGLGGKSFVLIAGDLHNVEAAVSSGVELMMESGSLIRSVTIPRLHEDMRRQVVG